jgi:methylphosphotriester-DNA--protein-cysteine methyltransferase
MKPGNRVTFASAEEARRAGYRACRRCKPDGVQ